MLHWCCEKNLKKGMTTCRQQCRGMVPLLEREKPMRRANRLFDIVEYLRRAKRVVTAQELAREMEVSVRTVYRDIADLQASRVPVEKVNINKAANRTEDFQKLNPMGEVPALLLDDGSVLSESLVICRYLDEAAHLGARPAPISSTALAHSHHRCISAAGATLRLARQRYA